jgi:hypothetical protein
MTTNTNSAAFTQLVDDLLWLHAARLQDGLTTAMNVMIAEYTADPDHYSDGSPVGTGYIPDYAPNVICFEPLPPPHRRNPRNIRKETPAMTTTYGKHINVVDALNDLIIQQGAVKFGKLAHYLETLGVKTAGDEELTGEHVNQPHVPLGTTLLGEVFTEYVEVVEALFKTRPVMLEIGDPASFASHEEPLVGGLGRRPGRAHVTPAGLPGGLPRCR